MRFIFESITPFVALYREVYVSLDLFKYMLHFVYTVVMDGTAGLDFVYYVAQKYCTNFVKRPDIADTV